MLKQNRFGQGKLSSENLKNHDAHTQKMLDTPLCSGFGQYHSKKHPTNPQPYIGITLNDILALLDNPQQVDKATAQWVIPSNLLSRVLKMINWQAVNITAYGRI